MLAVDKILTQKECAGIPERPNPNKGQWPDESIKKTTHKHHQMEAQHALE